MASLTDRSLGGCHIRACRRREPENGAGGEWETVVFDVADQPSVRSAWGIDRVSIVGRLHCSISCSYLTTHYDNCRER